MATLLMMTNWGKSNPPLAISIGLGLDIFLIIFLKNMLTA
jgi:hypothetical protein